MKTRAAWGVRIASVAVGVACLSCSNIVGIGDLPSNATVGPGPTGADVTPFLGSWTTTTGSATVLCNGKSSTNPDSYTFAISKGTSSDLVVSSGCDLQANVTSPTTASLVAGQTCTQTTTTERLEVTYTSGTFTIGATGRTATVHLAGTVVVTTTSGTGNCTLTQDDSFVKQ